MNKQQLANKIWESANKMRSKIEANEYKDYILGFIFYKFLSDKEVDFLKKDGYEEADLQEHVHENNEELVDYCQQHLGYLRRARFRRDNQHGAPFLVLYPLLQQLLVDLPKRAAQDHVQRRCAVENDSRI